jgi:hypothetical protein
MTVVARETPTYGQDPAGSGYCPRCHWAIDLHPYDAEGVDVGRCPMPHEQERLLRMLRNNDRRLKDLVNSFPAVAP